MSKAIGQFLAERSERERMLVVVASILLGLALAYAYIWLPVARERDRLLVRVPALRAEATAIERGLVELRRLNVSEATSIGPRAAIERAASASQLSAPLEITQQNPTTFRVAIRQASTDQAFKWIARLQSAAGIRVASIQLTTLEDVNQVMLEAMVVPIR